MRKTRIPNFIQIGRWEIGEKSGEPKSGERKIFFYKSKVFKKMQVFREKIGILGNREKCLEALMRRTRITNFIPIG